MSCIYWNIRWASTIENVSQPSLWEHAVNYVIVVTTSLYLHSLSFFLSSLLAAFPLGAHDFSWHIMRVYVLAAWYIYVTAYAKLVAHYTSHIQITYNTKECTHRGIYIRRSFLRRCSLKVRRKCLFFNRQQAWLLNIVIIYDKVYCFRIHSLVQINRRHV